MNEITSKPRLLESLTLSLFTPASPCIPTEFNTQEPCIIIISSNNSIIIIIILLVVVIIIIITFIVINVAIIITMHWHRLVKNIGWENQNIGGKSGKK